ncbi:MAG: stalk domain-containing protein [Tissierellia bacterium]|nr:stalk domain-containing protein [Tissierellia bacterium]
MKKRLYTFALLLLFLIPNIAHAITVEEVKAKGDYQSKNSVYGRNNLSQKELHEVALAVTNFYNTFISPEMDEMERFEAASKYLIENTTYAPTWKKNKANTAWGSLVYGQAQCSGYARGFKALCDAIDIPCHYVHAKGGKYPSHQWTMVLLQGEWYHYDPQLPFLMSDDDMASQGMAWDRKALPKTGPVEGAKPSHKKPEKEISIFIQGQKIHSDVPPIIKDGRTLVPIRVISENLGYTVEWYGDTKMILISKENYFGITEKALMMFVEKKECLDLNINIMNRYFPKNKSIQLSSQEETKATKLLVETSKIYSLDVTPKLINDRTMVPLRAIAELFGNEVGWDGENRHVFIQ